MDWNIFIFPFFGVFWLLWIAVLAFDVWMLIDAIQRPPGQYSSPEAKTWWIVGLAVGLISFLPAIAVAIAYYVIVRKPAVEGRARAGATAPPEPGQAAPSVWPLNCRACGAKLAAGARFCHSCGAPVASEGK